MKLLLANPVAALGSLLAVVLIALGLYGWGRHDGRALEAGKAAALVAAAKDAALASERRANSISDEVSRDFQKRLDDLVADAVPVRVVRLCIATGDSTVPAIPDSKPRLDAEEGGELPQQTGPDIGERLYALADEADRCSVQRDALIDWIKAQSDGQSGENQTASGNWNGVRSIDRR